MAKLDTITLHIEKEDENHKVEATMYPVEKGEPFTDHVAKRPSEYKLTGYIVSDNFEAEVNKLIDMMEKGKVVKYVGKMTAFDVIILDISGAHSSEIANGLAINISLRKIRITKTAWVKSPPAQKPARKPPTQSGKKKPVEKTPKKDTAVYHVMKKGQTYWYLYEKYGTSIPALRSWNKYPDRSIPIGAKLRVK